MTDIDCTRDIITGQMYQFDTYTQGLPNNLGLYKAIHVVNMKCVGDV